MGGRPGRRGVGLANWVVDRTSGFLDARLSRRSFIARTTLVGTALAASGCAVVTQPGSPYSRIADCGPRDLCRDGYTEFCCSINNGVNACPPNTVPAGWWRADFSVYCNGTRYYIDCNETCCGPLRRDGFCAGCNECRCAHGCDTRKVHCNYFRYGQCSQLIPNIGPIACRMVTCVPPYQLDLGCTPSGAVDNSTANHFTDCSRYAPPPPPPPPLPPGSLSVGSGVARTGGELLFVIRGPDGQVSLRRFTGGQWSGDWLGLQGETTSRIVLTSRHAGRADLFARGGDNGIWQRGSDDGVNWSAWAKITDLVASDPAPLPTSGGLWLFARGGDFHMYAQVSNGSGWPGWTDFGGTLLSNPVPVASGNEIHVFARGTDQAVHARHFDGTAWADWVTLGGSTDTDPGAVASGNAVFLFVKTGAGLQVRVFAGGQWGAWTTLRTDNVACRPEAVSFENRVYVFVRGVDQQTYFDVWDDGTWSGWASLEGTADAAPEPVVLGSKLFVFIRGAGDTVLSRFLEGSTWSDWTSLGGSASPVTAAP